MNATENNSLTNGIDYQEQESDVRSEPLKVLDVASTSVILVEPTPLPVEDVRMAEEPGLNGDVDGEVNGEVNGDVDGEVNGDVNGDVDVHMDEPTTNGHSNGDNIPEPPSTSATPGDSSSLPAALDSYRSPSNMDDDDKPPPAKRARTYSDADKASIAHSATPPPASASSSILTATNGNAASAPSSAPPPTSAPQSTLSSAQHRFCLSTVRQLKKGKDAGPFIRPVDPVALNIPHYPNIIKNPMDLSTIERKLNSSNPMKPDPNSENPRYYTADEFVADVRLVFSNCVTFNGPDHVVTAMGKRIEEVFDKQVKHMPPPLEVKPPVVKKPSTPPPAPAPAAKKLQPARRASTSVPVIRRSELENIGRPKREIHPPPPKDLPYADAPKKHRKNKGIKDDGTAEQLKFCHKMLQELHKKQHYSAASPFYEPVDWVKLEIPSYPKVVKKPMDLSTMRRKLDNKEYSTAQKFYDDFKLMIRNCFNFNPSGTPVNQAGMELQRLFDDKWKALPLLHDVSDDEEEEEEEDDSDMERARTIAMMESQIETMRGNLAALKGNKAPKEKKEKKKREKVAPPVASSSKANGKQQKAAAPHKRRSKNKPIADDDVLTFEQKKDLSEAIQKLDESKLEKVIQIIHEGVPEIRDSTEEIELEIDLLPAMVLTKLYNFVLRPLRGAGPKRGRTGKGTGTGGLKRKSMDEDVEAEKIRQLEERMRMFEQGSGGGGGGGGGGGSAGAGAALVGRGGAGDDSDHSSDSSSGSDSSGSDTE